MKYKVLFTVVLCACFSTCLIVFPSGGTQGAINGMRLCYSVIIPSLFPFTVCALILFDSGILDRISHSVDRISRRVFSLSGKMLTVFVISCIGGYPVGAKLIEKAYSSGELSKNNGETMLAYCVNSGPSFIIIAIGSGMLGSTKLGIVLFVSNTITSLLLALILSRFISPEIQKDKQSKTAPAFSELFVNSTYEACNSMIGICAFVVLFSSILGLIGAVIPEGLAKELTVSLLEITNGIALSDKNLYKISFMLGFAGLCVHFQVLSMCRTLKPKYTKFLLLRLVHGSISAIITLVIVKIFKISVPTLSPGSDISVYATGSSAIFSVALILLSICFMISVRNNYKIL